MKFIVWKTKKQMISRKLLLPALLCTVIATIPFAINRFENKASQNEASAVICDTVITVPEESPSETALTAAPKNTLSAQDIETEDDAVTKQPEPTMTAAEKKLFREDIPLSKEIQEFAINKCSESGVPYSLVLAIIEHESNFNANATHQNTNGTTDSGLMQINDIVKDYVYTHFGVTDLLDAKQNITAGVGILSGYLEKYGIKESVMAYAIGETGMKNAKAAGRTSTEATDEILELMEKYKDLL